MEPLSQGGAEIADALNITVRPIYLAVSMTEINVGSDEFSVLLENVRDLRNFLILMTTYVFEESLSDNQIELPAIKRNRVLSQVCLPQVQAGRLNSYIDSVIMNVLAHEVHKSGRTTTNIEQ
jgi:hypothetical protein